MRTPSEPTKPFPFHLTEGRHFNYRQAAKRSGMSMSEWMRSILDAAVDQMPAEVLKPNLDPLAILKGMPLAEYCRVKGVPNPETKAPINFWPAPPPPVVDESESKADRREREMLERHGEA